MAVTILYERGRRTVLTDAKTASEVYGTAFERASYVEPNNCLLRILFHILRTVFGDEGQVSGMTRAWPCLWRVNTKPVNGPILAGRWRNRQEAIDAEVEFLVNWFRSRKVEGPCH